MYSSKYEDRCIGAGMRTHAGGERRGERREERGEKREEKGESKGGQIYRSTTMRADMWRSTNRRGVS